MSISAHEVGSHHRSVYVIVGGPRHVKIGISVDVERRLKGLQTGCPFRVRLAKAWRTPIASAIEARAHRALEKYRTAGEWFGVPIRVAVMVIEAILARHPRNAATIPMGAEAVVFCNNCQHCAPLPKVPNSSSRFRCSRCHNRERVHVVTIA